VILEDHRRFRALFKEYEGLGDRAFKSKADLSAKLFGLLGAHEAMEEEIFYPAVREEAGKKAVDIVLEGFEEHHVADVLVAELEALDVEDETYDPKFKVLKENVEHHLEEEEDNLFPEARKALSEDESLAIGQAMLARKQELLAAGVS
jgi:iron-sulfur cluster repair protein YtfE (RIC family)